MQYRALAYPKKSKGLNFEGVEHLTKPSAGMSLKVILDRFTRGEAVPVGKDALDGVDYDFGLDIDYMKLRGADLVDKQDFIQKMQVIQDAHKRQQAFKEAQAKAKAEKEAEEAIQRRIQDEAQKLVSSGKP